MAAAADDDDDSSGIATVSSPSTSGWDRLRKMPAYARAGVKWLWIVDPGSRGLEIYELREGLWLQKATFMGGMAVRAEPFDAIELELWALWGEDGPSEPEQFSGAAGSSQSQEEALPLSELSPEPSGSREQS